MSSNYSPGVGNVGSYQMSGLPYATSSLAVPGSAGTPKEVSFPNIVRTVTIRNTVPTSSAPAPLRVGFSSNGVKGVQYNNFFVLANGESYTGEWRIAKLFLLGDTMTATSASVVAEITNIEVPDAIRTGNYTGSVGIG